MRFYDRFDDHATSLGGFYRAWVIQLGLELDLFGALRAAGPAGLTTDQLAAATERLPTRSRRGAAPRSPAISWSGTASGSASTRSPPPSSSTSIAQTPSAASSPTP